MDKLCWYPIFVLIAFNVMTVFADEYEYRLLRDLMMKYNKGIRPSKNASDTLNVKMGLALIQIVDVDEKNQILTTNSWLHYTWTDENLKWNPKKYDGIEHIRIPHTEIWKPDVILYNNADVSSYSSSIGTNVIVTSAGNVTWLSMAIFKSTCLINVKYFPFDEHYCTMLFASWTYDGYQVNLTTFSGEGDISNYLNSSEWDLLSLDVDRHVVYYSCCPEPYPEAVYTIHIRRRTSFYVFKMVLPCVLVTLVALLGFCLPPDSGEKITFGITTLLCTIVLIVHMVENMPGASIELPLIEVYYGLTMCIVSLAVGLNVLTLNIHHKGARAREVPDCVKRICFGILAKVLLLRLDSPGPPTATVIMKENPIGRISDTQSDGDGQAKERSEKSFEPVLRKVCQSLERNENRVVALGRREAIEQEWHCLALVVDRLLLCSFIIVVVTFTLAIMLQY